MCRLFLTVWILFAVVAPQTWAMGLDDAYASIPHRRTPYSVASSAATRPQTEALARLFELSDQAMVLRVRGLAAVRSRDLASLRDVLQDYRGPLDMLQKAPVAPEVQQVQSLVLLAVRQHKAFFETKLAAGVRDAVFTPVVYQASGNLRQAYSLLMAVFPKESPSNRQAFFDHLCALDFI